MPFYKLTYFDLPGRAEVSRLLFTVAGKPFEDERISFEDWPQLKEHTPFGTLPVLTVTSDTGATSYIISQSQSVARYVARKCNLLGKTEKEQAECEMYMEQANDVLIRGVTVAFEKDADTKKQMFENFQSEFMPKNLHVFNTQLKKNGTGFMVGKNLTAADLMLMVVLDNVLQSDPSYTSKEALADFPVVNSHYEKIKRIPAIATWNKKHPRK